MINLEDKLQKAFIANGIESVQQNKIKEIIGLLSDKDEATYNHSIRVGLLASEIADFIHLDSRALLYAGLLHDVGKIWIDTKILTKTKGFDEKDYQRIKKHVEYSYEILKEDFPFTADIIVRHHFYQTESYPETLPDYNNKFSKATRATIDFYAMILSLADFYDAASTRINNKFGGSQLRSKEEVKTMVLEKHPHFRKIIDELYVQGIF